VSVFKFSAFVYCFMYCFCVFVFSMRAWPGWIGPLPGGLTNYCPSVL